MSEDYLVYVGREQGTINGVPARNLNEEEANIHGEYRLIKSGLYKLAKPKSYLRKRKTEQEEGNNDERS